MIYTIIRKRQVFHSLANLPTDSITINKSLSRRGKQKDFISRQTSVSSNSGKSLSQKMMEGSKPAKPALPGTKTASLPAMPSTSLFVQFYESFYFLLENLSLLIFQMIILPFLEVF